MIFLLTPLLWSQTVERFPKPDFQSGYVRPELQTPTPRSIYLEYLDVIILFIALSLSTYFALKKRSRRHIFILMVFSLIYFGFYREGCVCSIGAIQNTVYAWFNPGYAIPLSVVAFFVIPLIFTLFFGRTFCAAVCPLGAIQDVVVLKPTKVPKWLSEVLSLIPYLYLSLAVLFAATGAGFIICQYDPFVGFFRFGASFNLLVFGIFLLILGTVVARPYCRFLCPYGVLLNWMSRVSKKHVTITPDECINCRLCEESCPFGAINKSNEANYPESREKNIRQLVSLLLLFPLIILSSGWIGSNLYIPLSKQHFSVALAEKLQQEDSGKVTEPSDETTAFRASGKPKQELLLEVEEIKQKFKIGGWFLGGFLGFIIMIKLINLTIRRKQTEYSTDNGLCLSCARCFSYCPIEQVRVGLITLEQAKALKPSE
jgi:NosR/NirI family nitrous oxide reductase transcriptional regulator